MTVLIPIMIAVLTLWVEPQAMQDNGLSLSGEVLPGALLTGRAAPGAVVLLDGQPIAVTADGRFVFGLARDPGPSFQLAIRYADGQETSRTIAIPPRSYEIERVDGLPPKTVTPPPEWLARRQQETRRVRAGRATFRDTLHWSGGFIKPAKGRFSGFYGSQRILNGKPRTPHYGLDIAAAVGTPVVAPAAGRVTLADDGFLLEGGIVIIDHGYRVTSTLFHLSAVTVGEGDEVAQGQVVGLMGAKGRASGSHVDWCLNWGGVRLDPALALPPTERP